MKILITAILLLPICILGQTMGKNTSPSRWKQDISIDGKLDEWKKSDFSYNEETRLWYSLANDDVYLYLAVKKDQNADKVFTWGGLQFSVSKDDKGSKPSIAFPLAAKNGRAIPHDQLTRIAVEGFQNIPEKELNLYNEYGIQLGWSLQKENEDEYTDPTYRYELAIPLSHVMSLKEKDEIKFSILLRGFREIRPSPQDIALAEQMDVSMQEKARQEMRKKMPDLPMEIINRNFEYFKDQGRWTEFWSNYRLATNPDI